VAPAVKERSEPSGRDTVILLIVKKDYRHAEALLGDFAPGGWFSSRGVK